MLRRPYRLRQRDTDGRGSPFPVSTLGRYLDPNITKEKVTLSKYTKSVENNTFLKRWAQIDIPTGSLLSFYVNVERSGPQKNGIVTH